MKIYKNNTWVETPYRKYGTEADAITSFPTEIIADGNNASAVIKGNMQQTGTPTPTNPIYPSECGDLETVGEKAGQYKIPISSGGTTTNVYLGEVQSTRQIKQLVLTGEESVILTSNGSFYISNTLYLQTEGITTVCSHYTTIPNRSSVPTIDKTVCLYTDDSRIYIRDTTYTTTTDFQTYLAQQYANGTPVTIWYVLATEETTTLNEPLRKIGDYADSVTSTVPTTGTAEQFNVSTTLKPSEVNLTYNGWHKHQDIIIS